MWPGLAWWLRHCATSWKVLGSIPGVTMVFSTASDSFMCPGVDSASKNEYQVNSGGKGSWCVSLTTYHLHAPMSRNWGALTSWNPVGLFRPVMGQLLHLHVYCKNVSHFTVKNALVKFVYCITEHTICILLT
jgi:hypothetical protein